VKIFVVALLLALAGCDEQQSTNKASTAQVSTAPQPPRREHHFEPIARSQGNLAVDTATGQMCKTWQFVCATDGDTYYNPYTKRYENRMSDGIACSAIRTMPTCESLSRQ
jgi:hypothetical protein